jgi:SAM-dependent methyltransferase
MITETQVHPVSSASPRPQQGVRKLKEHATPGLHQEAFQYVLRLFPSGCGPVLDLGGGTGAWSDRLLDHGFSDVVVFDLNSAQFEGKARFVPADLDQDFSHCLSGQRFPLITAVEVIEHLENPAHFLRECARLLTPDGVLIVTTPNIESMPARIKFFIQGRLRHFDVQGDRTHISPIDHFLLDRLAARAGLWIADRAALVNYWHDNRPFFRALAALTAPFVKGVPYGACHLFLLRAAVARQ